MQWYFLRFFKIYCIIVLWYLYFDIFYVIIDRLGMCDILLGLKIKNSDSDIVLFQTSPFFLLDIILDDLTFWQILLFTLTYYAWYCDNFYPLP